jgi:sugar phosphate isomerase/epimerase
LGEDKQMFTSLNPRMLGLSLSFEETLQAASDFGFEGVELGPGTLLEMPPETLRQRIRDAGLRPGGWSLPFDVEADEAAYEAGLRDLAATATRAGAVGATRCIRWIRPYSDDRDWDENWRFHVDRLGPVAAVLAEHGCRLGLEFVGPATSRRGHAYPFVHTIDQALSLCGQVGHGAGLLLDSWHWYTSGGTTDDIARMTNDDVVLVHLNDAPSGRSVDEQIDNQRLLPGLSGVIDISSFLGALRALNYDGPVVVEPFDRSLEKLDAQERLRATADALERVMTRAGGPDPSG